MFAINLFTAFMNSHFQTHSHL